MDYDLADSATYDLKDVRSLNSLSFIPSSVDRDFKNFIGRSSYKEPGVSSAGLNGRVSSATIRPSTHQALRTMISSVSIPVQEVKRTKMKASDANLHKVKEWRQKVFKKPQRKFSEADAKTRGLSAGTGKAW